MGWNLTVRSEEWYSVRGPGDPNNFNAGKRGVERNVIADPHTSLADAVPLLDDDVMALAERCAEQVGNLPNADVPFFSPFGLRSPLVNESDRVSVDDSGEEISQWVLDHLILPASLAHLRRLPSLRSRGDGTAKMFADDVLSVAQARDLAYRVGVPLAGLSVASKGGRIWIDDVGIRSVTPVEAGEYVKDLIGMRLGGLRVSCPSAMLELLVRTGRHEHNPDCWELVSKWLCGLELHGYKIAGTIATYRSNPEWVLPGVMGMPLQLATSVQDAVPIDRREFGKIGDTVKKLGSYSVRAPRSTQDLALHRFIAGLARDTDADAILDFAIALEALLLPYDSQTRHSDLSYRFRLHGAYYLAAKSRDRKSTLGQLRDLYNLRSRLVHGVKYPDRQMIEQGRLNANELARRGLLRAVREGFPKAYDFAEMTLR